MGQDQIHHNSQPWFLPVPHFLSVSPTIGEVGPEEHTSLSDWACGCPSETNIFRGNWETPTGAHRPIPKKMGRSPEKQSSQSLGGSQSSTPNPLSPPVDLGCGGSVHGCRCFPKIYGLQNPIPPVYLKKNHGLPISLLRQIYVPTVVKIHQKSVGWMRDLPLDGVRFQLHDVDFLGGRIHDCRNIRMFILPPVFSNVTLR